MATLLTPADVELSYALWLDASDTPTITIDTGAGQWADKSGNNNHTVQAVGANQPAPVSSPRAGLLFDGINDSLVTTSAIAGLPVTMFVVATRGTTKGPFVKIGSESNGVAIGYGGTSFDDSGTKLIGLKESVVWVTTNTTLIAGSVISAYFPTGTTSPEFKQSGVIAPITAGESNSPVAPDGYIYIGGYSTRLCSATIHEILIVQGVVSLENQQLLEGILHWKWGFENLLEVDHPYKDGPPVTNDVEIECNIETPAPEISISGGIVKFCSVELETPAPQINIGIVPSRIASIGIETSVPEISIHGGMSIAIEAPCSEIDITAVNPTQARTKIETPSPSISIECIVPLVASINIQQPASETSISAINGVVGVDIAIEAKAPMVQASAITAKIANISIEQNAPGISLAMDNDFVYGDLAYNRNRYCQYQ